MKPSVSAVIPTLGRPSLTRAVQSVLDQTYPVDEILVVADGDISPALPPDDRIMLLSKGVRGSAARSRQLGIDAARGTVIALLDDDDEWHPAKLQRQLESVDVAAGGYWIASSRMAVLGPGDRRRIWPRRLIAPGESLAEYLFRCRGLRVGGATLQTSTLCFPAELVREVPWAADVDGAHDEPGWLIRAQRAIPQLRVVQLPDVLSTYNVDGASVSRSVTDRTDEYIEWGLRFLSTESPRVLGDYLCTSPVSAAVHARSLAGVRRAVWSALRHGRPGPFALAYAALNSARIVARRAGSAIR